MKSPIIRFAPTILVAVFFLATLGVSSSAQTIRSNLDFVIVQRGVGLRETNSAYRASDGTYVNMHQWIYANEADARGLLEWQRQRLEPETVVSTPLARGRAVSGFYVDYEGRQRVAAIEQRGASVMRIDASSERHLEAFAAWCAVRAASELVEGGIGSP